MLAIRAEALVQAPTCATHAVRGRGQLADQVATPKSCARSRATARKIGASAFDALAVAAGRWNGWLDIDEADPRWDISTDDQRRPTLTPSVWLRDGCRSHFLIQRGRVKWCE